MTTKPYSVFTDRLRLELAHDELGSLYGWLAESPSGEAHDLHGLDTAISVLAQLIAALPDPTDEEEEA